MGFDMGFGMGFGMFNIMFFLIFGVVIVMFIVTAVKGISTWNKNNNSPRLTVEATVSSKRQNVDVHHHNTGDNNAMHTTTSTTYYVTFRWPAATGWSCASMAGSTASWQRAISAS